MIKFQYKIQCSICEKKYTRKSSLERHQILCEFLLKSKREKLINNEETIDVPTYSELVLIVQELALKNTKLLEKMEKIEKWIDNKKKKINIIDWLENNRIPDITFEQRIINLNLNIDDSDIEYLKENTIFQTIHKVWEKAWEKECILPIACFSQKQNIFYIYNSDKKWMQMKTEDFLKLLQKLQHAFINVLYIWRQNHLQEINTNDSMSILYNKMIIKIMNISLIQDANYSKIHANLYNYLKMDLKNMMEYEFEF